MAVQWSGSRPDMLVTLERDVTRALVPARPGEVLVSQHGE
jgi:hypothetical protein